MSKSSERRIIRDKITAFGVVACVDKAIEESAEKHEALLHLRDMLDYGSPQEIMKAVTHYAEEVADDQIAGKETLFRIWDHCNTVAQSKRHRAYQQQIPSALAELSSAKPTARDVGYDNKNACDCGIDERECDG